jgi:GntR family transcriptional regulator
MIIKFWGRLLMRVDRNDHLPLYIQLKNIIEEKIKEEDLNPGDIIPSEKELQQEFGVSRITVRQAIKELENEGLVKKKQGKGTFVSFPKLSHELPVIYQINPLENDKY